MALLKLNKNKQFAYLLTFACLILATLTAFSLVRTLKVEKPAVLRLARGADCEGEGSIHRFGGNTWQNCEVKMPIFNGDHLTSGSKDSIDIIVRDGRKIILEPNTSIRLHSGKNNTINVDLIQGGLVVRPWSNSKNIIFVSAGQEYFKLTDGTDFLELLLSGDGELKVLKQRLDGYLIQ